MQVAISLLVALSISGSDAITHNLCKPPPVALRSPGSLSEFGIEATRWAVGARDAECLLSPLVDVFTALDRGTLMSHHNGGDEVRTIRASTREQHYVFHAYPAGICRAMRWVYAGEKKTLDLFRPLAERIRPPIDAALCAEGNSKRSDNFPAQLAAASFIVVSERGVEDDGSLWHTDWGGCAPREGFTALLALDSVPTAARPAYELQFRASARHEVERYGYRKGDAVVFDGSLLHRTSPFGKSALAAASRPGERTLVCLNFVAPTGDETTASRATIALGVEQLRSRQRNVLTSQTPGYYELDGMGAGWGWGSVLSSAAPPRQLVL
jgi:hypothetical protein